MEPDHAAERHRDRRTFLDARAARPAAGGAGPRSRTFEAPDIGALRISEMDASGIDMQILSETAPAVHELDPDKAISLARRSNDYLHEQIGKNPTRFAGFAALPVSDPKAAADELERAVTKLGFKGAMFMGLCKGRFLDEKFFWPIFERAEKLDVPIYLHPSIPHPAVTEAYYKDYLQDFPMVIRAAWGFTVETATQMIRMVLSGVFDKYPNLKIIVGHLGETLPFLLWRIDQALSRPGSKRISFRDVFSSHVYLTTSGNFSNPALLCCVQELGIDRIMFAVDWPFVANPLGTNWVDTIPLCEEDKIKILSGNAKRLLRM
jgi:predicted TIM-barrel fold metal-dependent hydrolase